MTNSARKGCLYRKFLLAVAAIAVALGAEARSALPVGYQEVEYFTSFKTTVKTGYTPEVTDRVETKVYITGTSGNRGIFCARKNGSSVGAFTCLASPNSSSYSVRSDYGNYDSSRVVSGFKQGADMTVVFNNDDYQSVLTGQDSSGNILTKTVPLYGGTGGTVTTFDNNEGVVGSELLLFALHNGDVSTPTANTYETWMRCYYFRVYDRYGKLKMNLVPCKNLMTTETAKIYGFYDTVSQRFLEPIYGATDSSCGGGAEVYARDVEDLQELAYVDTPTNQWVNTGVKPAWCDRVEMRFRPLGRDAARALYWCRAEANNSGTFSALMGSTVSADGATLRLDRSDAQYLTTAKPVIAGQDTLLEYDGKTAVAKLNGVQQAFDKTMPKGSYTVASPLALFVAHNCGGNLASGHAKLYPTYARPLRFYGFKLTGTNGVAKLDIVPCRDGADGTVGLYDRVSRKFLTPTLFPGMTNDLLMAAGPLVECATNRLTMAVNAAGTSASLTFDASACARKLVLACGNTDAAGAFHAWENRAAEVEVAAGATSLDVALPEGFGTAYRVVRAFLGGVVSSESVFAEIPVTAKVTKEAGVPVSADLTFTGSTAARRLFLVWGSKDVGNVLTGWVGKVEIAGGVPAGVTSLADVAIPQEARECWANCGGLRFVIGDIATEKSYVQEGLFLQYDGINNAGIGRHSKKIDKWSDLVSSNDISVAETDESYPTTKDEIGDTFMKIRRHRRTTANEVIDARPDVQLTMESCMRPVSCTAAKNVKTFDLRYYGYMGWDVRGEGSMMIYRPTATERKKYLTWRYDMGGANFASLVNAAVFNTYSVTFGYGDAKAPDSPAYFDGVRCGHNATAASWSDTISNFDRQLAIGEALSVTDMASVRLYDRELTPEERQWNVRVDCERFKGGDPASLHSSSFLRPMGLVIVVE